MAITIKAKFDEYLDGLLLFAIAAIIDKKNDTILYQLLLLLDKIDGASQVLNDLVLFYFLLLTVWEEMKCAASKVDSLAVL